jgi:hypothetical protein
MNAGTIIDIARKLIALVLDIVPKEVAEQLLTDEAVKRQSRIADLAEFQKFGPTSRSGDE